MSNGRKRSDSKSPVILAHSSVMPYSIVRAKASLDGSTEFKETIFNINHN